jgi:hypothetical protein
MTLFSPISVLLVAAALAATSSAFVPAGFKFFGLDDRRDW